MTEQHDIERKFWRALHSDRTVMLGLRNVHGGHAQPMTVVFTDDDSRGPFYIFTSKDTDLARALGDGAGATIHFASKGHDLFAAIDGQLEPYNDRATIDQLWNPYVAAWFEGGKSDPKLLLLRFEPADALVWLNDNSFFAGIKLLLGRDPKREYADKVADLDLSRR
ncbi:MAG TPA: pyridoxamine 5'-phosphate oxidase family protein [Rhizomicrobium sp.]|nr:pyridoxamine 5'-phosphate oxidase family protein [Rhizomicrobium sp.]